MEQKTNDHFWKIKRFSLYFFYYAFIDTEEYMADQLFIRERVRVWFGHEYVKPGSPYYAIFCKCRKKDAAAFERAMEALPSKMLLFGHRDYIPYCKNLKGKLEQERNFEGEPHNEAGRSTSA